MTITLENVVRSMKLSLQAVLHCVVFAYTRIACDLFKQDLIRHAYISSGQGGFQMRDHESW